jgi:adenosylmethionine-8-amino-7-oxononanoate aminotransferase
MRMYDARYLARAREITARYGVHLIADEIMTGFGRTGTMFAWEQAAAAKPDLMCLSKGITGGHLPLSCVLASDDVYAAFYDDDVARGFLHSHSYTGNPLACAAALAVLDIFRDEDVIGRNRVRAGEWAKALEPVAAHPRVRNFRQRGMILAWEVATDRADFARWCFAQALAGGVLLRPIGNTVYVMPPYIVTAEEMAMVASCLVRILDTA